MKIIKRVLIGIVVCIVVLGSIFYMGLQSMLQTFSREINKVQINPINMSTIEDGVYEGEYHFNESVGAVVKVTVENQNITRIDMIEHKYGMGQKAEAIRDQVIEAQSLQVDAVSGATGSSVVILKAIENALQGN